MALSSFKIPWSLNAAALEICYPEYGLQKEIQITVGDSYEKCILLNNMPLLDLFCCSLNLLGLNDLKQWKCIVPGYRGWTFTARCQQGHSLLKNTRGRWIPELSADFIENGNMTPVCTWHFLCTHLCILVCVPMYMYLYFPFFIKNTVFILFHL